jgi:hypothetical protein
MRLSRKTALVFGAAALASVPALAAEHPLRPGQYEIRTEMKMEGMDRAMPPTTITHCYTEQDVKDYKKLAQEGQGRNRDCQLSDMKESGNHMSWTMTCKSGTKGSGEMTLGADGYETTMDIEAQGGPHGPMKMKIHATAKRTGDCSK